MIQVIHRALDILEFVASHGKEPVQLLKIAENAGLSQPTTANIVKSLVEKNYLEQVGRKVGYRLGMAAYQLTNNKTYDQDLITAAKEPLQELTSELNETSLIAVIRNHKRVIVHLEESNQMLQVRAAPVANVYDTSSGRLLMAYLASKDLENLIKAVGLPSKSTWPGADSKNGLEKELEKIRKEGAAWVKTIHHTLGVAVPVYQEKQVVAAISVFIPASRFKQANKEKLTKLVMRAAKKISASL